MASNPNVTPLDVHHRVWDRIQQGWCKGSASIEVDENQEEINPGRIRPFPLDEAIEHAAWDITPEAAQRVFSDYHQALGSKELIEFNDHPDTTKSDVIELVNRCIVMNGGVPRPMPHTAVDSGTTG